MREGGRKRERMREGGRKREGAERKADWHKSDSCIKSFIFLTNYDKKFQL
jgi:hypothetical protein